MADPNDLKRCIPDPNAQKPTLDKAERERGQKKKKKKRKKNRNKKPKRPKGTYSNVATGIFVASLLLALKVIFSENNHLEF